MEIQFLGQSCFRIKGKETIVLTDPYSPKLGVKLPLLTADIVTLSHSHSHDDHCYLERVKPTNKRPEPFVIDAPGEYEISGVFVYGLSTFHDEVKGKKRGRNVVYLIEIDKVKLVHLGDLGHQLSQKELEIINGVDILIIPVGGVYTLDSKEAIKLISQVEPRLVIPMHYSLSGLRNKELKGVDEFLKEIGAESVKPIEKLVISKDKLPEEREVIVLKIKR